MCERTFAQTVADAGDDALIHKLALAPILDWFVRTTGVQLKGTLRQTIEAIPSAQLPLIDFHMVRSIVPAASMEEMPSDQAVTALNGLVFVRIVEVSKPRLAQRARVLREDILDFYETAYTLASTMRPDIQCQSSEQPVGEYPAVAVAPIGIGSTGAPLSSAEATPSGNEAASAGTVTQRQSSGTSTPDHSPNRRGATIALVVVGIVASLLAKTLIAEMRHATSYSNAYSAEIYRQQLSQPTAATVPPVAVPSIPEAVTSTTKAIAPSQWAVSVSREHGTVPASVYKREDMVALISSETCGQAKEMTKQFYHERLLQDRPVRVDMIEERMAVEFFACNPDATTWSSTW